MAISSATIAVVTPVFAIFGASWLNLRQIEKLLDQLEKRFEDRITWLEKRFEERFRSTNASPRSSNAWTGSNVNWKQSSSRFCPRVRKVAVAGPQAILEGSRLRPPSAFSRPLLRK